MKPTTHIAEVKTSVTVRLFARLRELTGLRHLEIQLERPETVRALLDRLVVDYPEIAPYRSAMRGAVNREYVDDTHMVADGDELAIITPVSGG